MNKKETGFWERYLWSIQKHGLRGIEDCYDKPSQLKKEAYRCIVSANPGARYMTVVVASPQTFTVGWLEQDKNGNWGFEYQTACQCYEVPVTEEMKVDAQARGICPWKK